MKHSRRLSILCVFFCNLSQTTTLVLLFWHTHVTQGHMKRLVWTFRLSWALFNVCQNNFEFKNQRRKSTLLAAQLLASNRVNFAINRALLNIGLLLCSYCRLFYIKFNSHFIYLFIIYNTITSYIQIIYELSNFDLVVGVVP